MRCNDSTLVKQDEHGLHAVTQKCRAWTCEMCCHDRARQLVAKALSGDPITFVTLTSNPAYLDSPEARARAMVDAWREVMEIYKKEHGVKETPYFCVFEATKNGEPHIHIVSRLRWIDQAWLKAHMERLIKAPNVWVTRIRSTKQCGGYLAKYIGKGPHKFGNCKRYWCTKNWEKDEWEKEPDPFYIDGAWLHDTRDLATLEHDYRMNGWTLWATRGNLWGFAQPPPW